MPLPSYIKVIDSLLYNSAKNVLTSPEYCRIQDSNSVPSYVKDQYEFWFSFPKNSIFKYACPNLPVVLRTITKTVVPADAENTILFKESKVGQVVECYLLKNGRDSYYIFNNVDSSGNICENFTGSLSHQSSDVNVSDLESPTGLITVYNLPAFAHLFEKLSFPGPQDIYFDLKYIMIELLIHFKQTNVHLTLPADKHSSRVQDSMHSYSVNTMGIYFADFKMFYYYLLNLSSFAADEKLGIDASLVEESEMLRSQVSGLETTTVSKELVVRKIKLLRPYVIKVIENEQVFSTVVRACFINGDKSIKVNGTCASIINAIRYFLKHLLVYTNGNCIPEEFRKAYIDNEYPSLDTLHKVFWTLKQKSFALHSSYNVVKSGDRYLVSGLPFTAALVKQCYSKLINIYNDNLEKLKLLNVGLVNAEKTYNVLKGKYTSRGMNFYECYPTTEVGLLWNACNIRQCKNEIKRAQIYECFNEITYSLILLIFISSGGLIRLYEIPKLSGVSTEKPIFTYSNEGRDYVYFSTVVNKNNNFQKRLIFCNNTVSKYVINYMVIIKQAFAYFAGDLPVDESLYSNFGLMNQLNYDDATLDEICAMEPMAKCSGIQFIRTHLFVICNHDGSKYTVSKAPSNKLSKMIRRVSGNSFSPQKWRQFFMHVSEEVGKVDYQKLVDYVNSVIFRNAGHSVHTHLNWYSRLDDDVQVERTAFFNVSFDIMVKVNSVLLDEEVCEDVSIENVVKTNQSVYFSGDMILEAARSLYNDFSFRANQEMVLGNIGMCPHNYVLQAPTGFGKTVVFSIIIKLFRIHYPDLINIVVVPYTLLKEDMVSRLISIGFSVGNFKEIDTKNLKDVYVGCFESIPSAQLEIYSNLGLAVFDEAHTINDEISFREIIPELNYVGFDRFKKILFTSATIKQDVANNVFDILKIKSPMVYSNMIFDLPIENFYSHSINCSDINRKYVAAGKESPDRMSILLYYLNHFTANMINSKALVFFNNREQLEKFQDCHLTVHGKMETAEKIQRFNQFKKNVDVLLGTKLMSNGLNISEIKMVVFYNYVPDPVELIQAMGRIRNKGLILFITNFNVCIQKIMSSYYNINKETHFNCCNLPKDLELTSIFNYVVHNLDQDVPNDLPLPAKMLRCRVLKIIDNSFREEFHAEGKYKAFQLRMINDPFFLYCYRELSIEYPNRTVFQLQVIFVALFMGYSNRNQVLKKDGFADFVAKSNFWASRFQEGGDSTKMDSKFLQLLQSSVKSIEDYKTKRPLKYFGKDLVFPLNPIDPNLCPKCLLPEHGVCNRPDARFFLLASFLGGLEGKRFKGISRKLFSLFFLMIQTKENGNPLMYLIPNTDAANCV